LFCPLWFEVDPVKFFRYPGVEDCGGKAPGKKGDLPGWALPARDVSGVGRAGRCCEFPVVRSRPLVDLKGDSIDGRLEPSGTSLVKIPFSEELPVRSRFIGISDEGGGNGV
jgi:hypothetical protein